jgi:hypothetical protein
MAAATMQYAPGGQGVKRESEVTRVRYQRTGTRSYAVDSADSAYDRLKQTAVPT